MWKVDWSKKSFSQLKKLDKPIAQRIVDRVDDSKDDPYAVMKRLVNSPYFRLRVGDYRIITDLQRDSATIFVVQIDPRKDDYKALGRM